MTFSNKPILLFWETTKACPLHCVHCRADAIERPLPGELNTEEGKRLIDQVAAFGKPAPLVIFTGGDPLLREDLYDLFSYASANGISFAVAPAVSKYLTSSVLDCFKSAGVNSISVSLDGSTKGTHDSIRKSEGTYDMTVRTIKYAVSIGLNIQVNTAVMHQNVNELPELFQLIKSLGVKTWEVFFLIKTGRGVSQDDLSPYESESVCNFLYDASQYGIVVRTVEAPFIRRVAAERSRRGSYWDDGLYVALRTRLFSLCGSPSMQSTIRPVGTLDGDGTIFVSHDGTIYPGGFVPKPIGNVKSDVLADIYTKDSTLVAIRERKFEGICGECEYRHVCGGSRARAYSYAGNPLGSDPACIKSSAAPNDE